MFMETRGRVGVRVTISPTSLPFRFLYLFDEYYRISLDRSRHAKKEAINQMKTVKKKTADDTSS